MKMNRHVFTFRVPNSVYEGISQMAEQRGTNISPLLNQLLYRGYQIERAFDQARFTIQFNEEVPK
jgi:hypothetical protein